MRYTEFHDFVAGEDDNPWAYVNAAAFEKAIEAALRSPGVSGSNHRRFRLGAILLNTDEKLCNARFNTYKTHPILAEFTQYPFLHAESATVVANDPDDLTGGAIYVARVRADFTVAMARPCPVCIKVMKKVGIRECLYTTPSGYGTLLL